MTTSDGELKRVTTNDNDWYNEWQQVSTNDNEWQRVTKSGTTSKNGTAYFKEWMIAILDTLLQEMDG